MVGPSEDEQWWWYDQCAVMNCIRYNSDGTSTEADREGKKYIYHYILQLSTNEENDKMNTYGWKKIFCDIYANTLYLKAMNIKGNKMTLIKHIQWLKLLHIY